MNTSVLFNEQTLESLIQIDESEVGLISSKVKKAAESTPSKPTETEPSSKTKTPVKSRAKSSKSISELLSKSPTTPIKTPTKTPPKTTTSTKATSSKSISEILCTKTPTKPKTPVKETNKLRVKLRKPIRRKQTSKKTTTPAAAAPRRKLAFKKRTARSTVTKGFTFEVINELVKEFNENDYPSTKQKEAIAARLNLSMRQIATWYRNRRTKLNRRKRVPTHLTNYLIKEYNKNKQPDEQQIQAMSNKTKLPIECITNWFENRRKTKEKNKRAIAFADYLSKKYNENKYPNRESIKQMALETNLTPKKITIWFRSKRARLKQTNLKGFTAAVQQFLQDKYNQNKYPDALTVLKMSLEIKVSTFQINNWFKRRRFLLGHTKMNKYSPQIINYLTECFNRNNNPSPDDIVFMAFDINLTTNQIQQWFNDTRHRLNRTTRNIQVTTNDSQVENIVVKKTRSAKYPKHVVDYLTKAYEENKYPETQKIQEIVAATNLATRQIFTWFNDRRKKFKQTTPNKFPQHVIDYLVQNYVEVPYPSGELIEKMALNTRLTTQQINQWFMHRRHKHKRKKKGDKSSNETLANISVVNAEQTVDDTFGNISVVNTKIKSFHKSNFPNI